MAQYIVLYRIEYRDIEVVSWHIFIAIITPQTKSIFRTTLSHQHVAVNALGDIDKGSLVQRDR